MSGSVSMEASRGLTAYTSCTYRDDTVRGSVELRKIGNKVMQVSEVASCNRLEGDALNN